jgi:hypothetical protein
VEDAVIMYAVGRPTEATAQSSNAGDTGDRLERPRRVAPALPDDPWLIAGRTGAATYDVPLPPRLWKLPELPGLWTRTPIAPWKTPARTLRVPPGVSHSSLEIPPPPPTLGIPTAPTASATAEDKKPLQKGGTTRSTVWTAVQQSTLASGWPHDYENPWPHDLWKSQGQARQSAVV